MTTDGDDLFVDTNVLVFATLPASPIHDAARDAVHQRVMGGARLWISRQVIRELLARLTRPDPAALSLPDAVRQIEGILQVFAVADGTSEVTECLCRLLRTVGARGKQVHDANIVATMQAYRIDRLLTHNVKDFTRYQRAGLITIEAP